MTGKFTSIARPYATAAFEYALAQKALNRWKQLLEAAAAVSTNAEVSALLENPEMTDEDLNSLFADVLSKLIDSEEKNFIHLLIENKRIAVLPDISALFNDQVAAFEKKIDVKIVSAIALDDKYKQKFIKALTKRFNKEVILHCEVDPTLLGGAMIYAGDTVIDGSVRGKLNRLVESL